MIKLLVLWVAIVAGGCTVSNSTCYVDDNNRILGSTNQNSMDGNNNEWCAQLCHQQQMRLAGTEFGNECYCGNSIRNGATKAPSTECNMPCTGYHNETCGGTWRISIFTVNCEGTPVPPPPEIPRLSNPCLNHSQPYHMMPFCDPSLDMDLRVKDAVSRMTLSEKINSLGTDAAAIQSLGTVAYNWWSEATHGIATFRTDNKTPFTTNFAFPITTAMSFNRSLWWSTASHIAHEARTLR
eukprot:TRINITY_DN5024_c0_g4_i1.p1 TRINITY_DN5024_c0_g4~~TRINITY_DN5024_c0_g4_i1.p1  ORF type:complete len:239 (+),score=18.48 TRINITY_DN5024_c0_g4_i1:56-772(+)